MSTWYRVFGTNRAEPAPADLLEHLQTLQPGATGTFRGDTDGWFKAELTAPEAAPLLVERYLATEEGIRDELNTWAAWVEIQEGNPHRERLMRHMIGTVQLFTLLKADRDPADSRLCVAICRFLAAATDGLYQVDDLGFFEADGTVLLRET